jgi:hypothetical protein
VKINEIGTKIQKLLAQLIPEVLDYIYFLLSKYEGKKPHQNKRGIKFKFDWEGGLSKLKDQYTSIELQHKSLDWR